MCRDLGASLDKEGLTWKLKPRECSRPGRAMRGKLQDVCAAENRMPAGTCTGNGCGQERDALLAVVQKGWGCFGGNFESELKRENEPDVVGADGRR